MDQKTIKTISEKSKIQRHGFAARFVHWAVALSIFSLFISGFGQFPIYKRFGVVNLPGMSWTGDYHLTLTLHYIGALILIFAITYHLVYHLVRKELDLLPRRGDFMESLKIIASSIGLAKAPQSDKYLAEERISYAFMGINVLVLIISGIIKVFKNSPGANLSETTVLYTTMAHNLATVLLLLAVLGHLAAFILKENRFLIPGMFGGKVDLDYVKHRHRRWYDQLLKDGEIKDAAIMAIQADQSANGNGNARPDQPTNQTVSF